jgi:hypothetical protein
MTIVETMMLIAFFGVAMHVQKYWIAGFLVAVFAFRVWYVRRAARRRARAK